MTENKVQIFLAGKPQRFQVCPFWKDIPQLDMFVFKGAFLTGLHRIAVEHKGTLCAIRTCFHSIGICKLRTSVGKEHMDILSKYFSTENGFGQVNALFQ